jgi:hypothetical protein
MIYGKNPSFTNILRELEPFEKNSRCLKSVRVSMKKTNKIPVNSHFFKTTDRESFCFNNRIIPKPTDDPKFIETVTTDNQSKHKKQAAINLQFK